MRFWNKDLKTKADNRVARMETSALTGWMDNSIMGLGQAFDDWRFRNASKDVVSETLTVISAIWDELEKR